MATLAAEDFKLSDARRIVVKIGSALLVNLETGEPASGWLEGLARDIATLHRKGVEVVIVSSGAIALGRRQLGLALPQLKLDEKQACAAAGQALLTQAYDQALAPYSIVTAQALLTLTDTEDRRHWLNARATLNTLLRLGAVPIINENDTVATDEIRYGDNDRLAARVTQMIGADTLVLLSDIDGLYESDPHTDPHARHIPRVSALTPAIMAMGEGANIAANVGTGGMATKLLAAQIATRAGAHMVIARGKSMTPLSQIDAGARCTWFAAKDNPDTARKQWMSGSLDTKGQVHIDAGAAAALLGGSSLLPAGITRCEGDFSKGDLVEIIDPQASVIARGFVCYDAAHAKRIIGQHSSAIETILGYSFGDVFVHRDDMVVLS